MVGITPHHIHSQPVGGSMQRSVAFLLLMFVFASSASAKEHDLVSCVHRSLQGDQECWREGLSLLVQEKTSVQPRYDKALQLLAQWYGITATSEQEILDRIVTQEGFTPHERMRWQVSALLIIALQQGAVAPASSSKLRAIWRFLRKSWYGLVLAALIVYYGWQLLARLFPALASLFKKLLPSKRTEFDGLACGTNVVQTTARQEEDDDAVDGAGVRIKPCLFGYGDDGFFPWDETVTQFPPSPPDEPGAPGAVVVDEETQRTLGQKIGDGWCFFRDWWRRDGNGEVMQDVIKASATVAVAAASAHAATAAAGAYGAMEAAQRMTQPSQSAPSQRERFQAAVIPRTHIEEPADMAVSRSVLPSQQEVACRGPLLPSSLTPTSDDVYRGMMLSPEILEARLRATELRANAALAGYVVHGAFRAGTHLLRRRESSAPKCHCPHCHR
jgi:hypothetical protein